MCSLLLLYDYVLRREPREPSGGAPRVQSRYDAVDPQTGNRRLEPFRENPQLLLRTWEFHPKKQLRNPDSAREPAAQIIYGLSEPAGFETALTA